MSRSSIPIDEILDALDLSRAEPGIGLLQALFSRFNARVPLETASEIVRRGEVGEVRQWARRPELFWREHLELGTGGTGFARVAAFNALLSALGFRARKILGRVREDFDHAALLVEESGHPFLCDVGFPLPAPLAAEPCEIETPLGKAAVSRVPRGFAVDLAGIPEGPRRVELFEAAVSEEEFERRWLETLRPGSELPEGVSLCREMAARVLSFWRGELRVDDLHSRLRVPLGGGRAARLSELFEMDAGLLARAFTLAGDPEPGRRAATLTAYLEVAPSPERAFAAIGSREAYAGLMRGVAQVEAGETQEGWLLRLAGPGAEGEQIEVVEEIVRPDPAARTLRVVRRAGASSFESLYRAEERAGKTWLIREAILSGPREDLLRNDSLRGRLAGTLAVDLLAWARRI